MLRKETQCIVSIVTNKQLEFTIPELIKKASVFALEFAQFAVLVLKLRKL